MQRYVSQTAFTWQTETVLWLDVKFEAYLRQVGRNIKDYRVRAGLTQVEVHSGSGLTYRHYQNIEAGRVNITLETLYRLARFFDVPIEDLLKDC